MMDVGVFLYLTGSLIGRVGLFAEATGAATGFGVMAVGAVFPRGIWNPKAEPLKAFPFKAPDEDISELTPLSISGAR